MTNNNSTLSHTKALPDAIEFLSDMPPMFFGVPATPILDLIKLNLFSCDALETLTKQSGISEHWVKAELSLVFQELKSRTKQLNTDITSALNENYCPSYHEDLPLNLSDMPTASSSHRQKEAKKFWQPENSLRDELDAIAESQYFASQLFEAFFNSSDTHESTQWSLFNGGFIQWKNWMRTRHDHIRQLADEEHALHQRL